MANYVISRRAIKDLEEIWQYTYTAWSELQADKYYELLTSMFITLTINPALGKSYKEVLPGLSGIRVGQHIIFYRMENLNRIEIIRILHVRMDLNSHFNT
jgi:toxin ParE1/3/4